MFGVNNMNIITESQGQFGANCYMVSTAEAALLIDVFALTEKVREFIKDNEGKQMLILATHRHFDHVAGIYDAHLLSGAAVGIGALDACGLESREDSLSTMFAVEQTEFTPHYLFSDGDVINIGDIAVRVIHTPGHTEGSVCYLVANVIFSGDTLFKQSVGRTDLPTGNRQAQKESLNKLFALPDDYTVYPGHDAPTTLFYERSYNPYI